MKILLIILFGILSLIIYPNYSVYYAGEELKIYKIGLILGILSVMALLIVSKDYINKKKLTNTLTVLYDILNGVLVSLIILVVGTLIVYLYRINKFTGEVYSYGKLCIKKIYDMSEKAEWLENLKNTVSSMPKEILEKAKEN